MSKSKPPLSLDLSEFITTIQSFPVTKLSKFDNLLGDIANEVYDTYEYLIEIKPASKYLIKDNPELNIKDLTIIDEQSNMLADILEDMDYDSKWMDRLQNELYEIIEVTPKLIKKLQSISKK